MATSPQGSLWSAALQWLTQIVRPAHRAPALPPTWQHLPSSALWDHIARRPAPDGPDPRRDLILGALRDGTFTPTDLPLAMGQWLMAQDATASVALFPCVGYNLELFARSGTPAHLNATLQALPAGWSPRPVAQMASTVGWSALWYRGGAWMTVLAQWAGATMPSPAQWSPIEARVGQATADEVLRLILCDPTDLASIARQDMAALYDLLSEGPWAQWVAEIAPRPVSWDRERQEFAIVAANMGFVSGDMMMHGPYVALQNPIQALAHDRLWKTNHTTMAWQTRGAHRWHLATPAQDRDLVRRALLTWGTSGDVPFLSAVSFDDLTQLIGSIAPADIARFLKSPDQRLREHGLALMGRAAAPPAPPRLAPAQRRAR